MKAADFLALSPAERAEFRAKLDAADRAHAWSQRQKLRPAFARWLRTARLAAGMTQAAVGTGLGLTRAMVANYEAGTQAVTVEMFVAMCDVMGALDPVTEFRRLLEAYSGDDAR